MTGTYRVRLGLVAVMSLLALLVMIQPGHSQPPRGGIIGGPPGGFPGGQPPGIPNFPQPPQIPQPPNAPRPPGFGGGFGIRGGGIGGGQTEWRCGRCGAVVATGPTPPAQAVCPRCQATNVPPGTPRFPGIGGAAPPGGTPPQIGPPALPPQGGLPQPILPQPGLPQPELPQDGMMQVQPIVEPPAPPVNVYVPPNSSNSSSSNSRGSVAWVVIVTLGVFLLLGVGIAGVVFALMKNQPAKKRQRPRRRYEDDDDY